jgi:PEP-CTERM motif
MQYGKGSAGQQKDERGHSIEMIKIDFRLCFKLGMAGAKVYLSARTRLIFSCPPAGRTQMGKVTLAVAIALSNIAFVTTAAPAAAQSAPQSRTITVTFFGTVTNDVTKSIRIRQADGSYVPFTGAVPDYPYKVGDSVTISFNAVVPTRAAYEAGGALANAASADGIYRISVRNPFYASGGGPLGIGNSTIADPSGPINPVDTFGQPTNTRMTLVYDAIADSYSIDFTNGQFTSGAYSGPSYLYDAATQTLTPCTGSACGNGGFSISGNANQLATSNIGITGTAAGNGPQSGPGTGLFNLLFSGSWNLPSYNAGGGPIDVPEPATMILFAGGAAAVVRRRRRALRAA